MGFWGAWGKLLTFFDFLGVASVAESWYRVFHFLSSYGLIPAVYHKSYDELGLDLPRTDSYDDICMHCWKDRYDTVGAHVFKPHGVRPKRTWTCHLAHRKLAKTSKFTQGARITNVRFGSHAPCCCKSLQPFVVVGGSSSIRTLAEACAPPPSLPHGAGRARGGGRRAARRLSSWSTYRAPSGPLMQGSPSQSGSP